MWIRSVLHNYVQMKTRVSSNNWRRRVYRSGRRGAAGRRLAAVGRRLAARLRAAPAAAGARALRAAALQAGAQHVRPAQPMGTRFIIYYY